MKKKARVWKKKCMSREKESVSWGKGAREQISQCQNATCCSHCLRVVKTYVVTGLLLFQLKRVVLTYMSLPGFPSLSCYCFLLVARWKGVFSTYVCTRLSVCHFLPLLRRGGVPTCAHQVLFGYSLVFVVRDLRVFFLTRESFPDLCIFSYDSCLVLFLTCACLSLS